MEKGGEKLPGYTTYMKVNFTPGGLTPGEITNILREHGWKPVYGAFDFAYKWEGNWGNKDTNIQEFLDFINTTHAALVGSDVTYSLCTCEHGKENFYVKWCE